MKYQILAATVIQDFNRRGIPPDWEHEVTQGIIKLWRLNQKLLPELHIGKTIITGKCSYVNTLSPQDIADDLMVENKLGEAELTEISLMGDNPKWLTTVDIENKYGLPKGSVRRDIHRKKFEENEIKKVGRDWLIGMDTADKLYDKKRKIAIQKTKKEQGD